MMQHLGDHFLSFAAAFTSIPFIAMVMPRLTGTHHHMFDNVIDIQPGDDAAEGDVLTLDEDLHPVWSPPTGGGGAAVMRFYIPFGSGDESFAP